MKKVLLPLFVLFTVFVFAQNPVRVGKGSYAEYTPLYMCKTENHTGDQSRVMENRTVYVTEENKGRALPTNDWWSDLFMNEYISKLWAYPLVAKTDEHGVFVYYPREWNETGNELELDTRLEIYGNAFNPSPALVSDWHDWDVQFVQRDGDKELKTTLAHGMPFVWFETKNLTLKFQPKGESINCLNGMGQIQRFPFTGTGFVLEIDGYKYGVYAPEGTTFTQIEITPVDREITVHCVEDNAYMVIGALNEYDDFNAMSQYALVVPRKTEVDWNYNETSGVVTSTWRVETENLSGGANRAVMQGFLPHHYKNSQLNFALSDTYYPTPRGKMRMATGNTFSVSYEFNGVLPYFAAPELNEALANPFQRDRMVQMISEYAERGTFGDDTYWGGKGLTQMAMYMTFAHELGETELFEKCKKRLKTVLTDWLTFTPGETKYFFARYSKWGAMIGYNTTYDADRFNDHHFHYGYFTLASALLSFFDEDFKNNYGKMASLVAKDYANWDRNDTDYPLFRTMDPWAGHSYAGGFGSWNGNGQESSSESMQGWGGLYLLGVALGDKEMRDAGIFGWETESRGTAEYWFDRDRENIDYTKYTSPYNCNLTSAGVGWWTWFSGDNAWIHGIQWMPISTCLKYLYKDLDFAAWDYATMDATRSIGGFDVVPQGDFLSRESGLGNVALSYLQISDPDRVAAIFDTMWDNEMPVARNVDTGGITYYITHSHRSYGEICWNIHADVPTATAYLKDGVYTYMVYNPESTEKLITFYENNNVKIQFSAGPNRLTVYRDEPRPTSLEWVKTYDVVAPNNRVNFEARVLDQYGATYEAIPVWNTTVGTIENGQFTAPAVNGMATLTVSYQDLEPITTEVLINEPSVKTSVKIIPETPYAELGSRVESTLEILDQYGNALYDDADWKILYKESVISTDSVFYGDSIGIYTITATLSDNQVVSREIYICPMFQNIALGKQASASSLENAGYTTDALNDDDYTTRWSSQHADPQWVAVDLNQESYIGYLKIVWENAYSKTFDVQVSNDGNTWNTVSSEEGTGGTQLVLVDASARYVRLYSKTRVTNYGVSMYEFEVHGVEPVDDEPTLFFLEMGPSHTSLIQNQPTQLVVTPYDQFGNVFGTVTPTYTILEGAGTITNDGVITPTQYGSITVEASANGKKVVMKYQVEEALRLTSIAINPPKVTLVEGDSISFSYSGLDQFNANYTVAGEVYSVSGNGSENVRLVGNKFYADAEGVYNVKVSVAGLESEAEVRVAKIDNANLAFRKPIMASSYEHNGLIPSFANDGDIDTYWASKFTDDEWLMIDLEDEYRLTNAVFNWQLASPKDYDVQISFTGDKWVTVDSKTNMPEGYRTDEIDLTGYEARYIKIVFKERNTVIGNLYGYSIMDMRVYGSQKVEDLPEMEYDNNCNLLKTNALDLSESYFAPNNMVRPMSENDGEIIFNMPLATAQSGDAQVKIKTDIALEAGKKYDFYLKLTPTVNLVDVSVKFYEEGNESVFFPAEERGSGLFLTANKTTVVAVADMMVSSNMSPITILCDFGGNPAGTVVISDIVLKEKECEIIDCNLEVELSVPEMLSSVNPAVVLSASASDLVSYRWSTGDTSSTISVNEAGAYSVVVTNENGCDASASVLVQYELAIEGIATSNENPKEGDVVTYSVINAQNNVTYEWQLNDYNGDVYSLGTGSSINYNWTTAGNYTINVVATLNGVQVGPETLAVAVAPVLDIEIRIFIDSIEVGHDFACMIVNPVDDVWYEWTITGGEIVVGQGGDAVRIHPTGPGIYILTITPVKHGVVGETYTFELRSDMIGLGINAQTTNVEVYPNPTLDVVNIKSDLEIDNLDLYDITGNLLIKSINTNTISMSQFPAGLYILRIKSDDYSIEKTVIKR